MKNFKRITVIAMAAASVASMALLVMAADQNPLLSFPQVSPAGATTNIVVFPKWPTYIAASTAVTNFTRIDVSQFKDFCIQFNAQGTNAGSSGAVYLTMYPTVSGMSPTNAAGTGCTYGPVMYLTNTISGSGTTTAMGFYSANPRATTVNGQSTDNGFPGINAVYIASITAAASTGVTNYAVWLETK